MIWNGRQTCRDTLENSENYAHLGYMYYNTGGSSIYKCSTKYKASSEEVSMKACKCQFYNSQMDSDIMLSEFTSKFIKEQLWT